MATSETSCVCHLVARGGCQQGQFCPLREIEMACSAPLDPSADFPAPKGKRMQNYRFSSSAYTGRAPRSMNAAFGCHPSDPVHPMPTPRPTGLFARFTAWLFGR